MEDERMYRPIFGFKNKHLESKVTAWLSPTASSQYKFIYNRLDDFLWAIIPTIYKDDRSTSMSSKII